MYASAIVEKRLAKLQEGLRRVYGEGFRFRETPYGEVDEAVERLGKLWIEGKGLIGEPDRAQMAWIAHEIARSKADFAYWAERYAKIKTKSQQLRPLRFLESQKLILQRVGEAEVAAIGGQSGDGILIQLLKARQLGGSTLTEAMIAHRTTFYGNTTALVAADVPEQSAYLFDMIERIHEHLPWWMRPEKTNHVKDKELYFGKIDSKILVSSAKEIRGGDSKEKGGGDKGSIGTGKTMPLVHLSELALWPNAGQLDDALEPAIPRHPRTLAVYESTAKGRGNWWHQKWLTSRQGLGRFTPVFIPWYGEDITYTRPAPLDWDPSPITVAHAEKAREVSARWLGRTVELTRNQLYWWETTRADHIARKKLHVFLAEYAADDLEAFQHSGRSIFGSHMLHEMRQGSRLPTTVIDMVSGADYATTGV